MARPRKHGKVAKREAPVQFRLESDLGRLVHGFAQRHGLGLNEAAKSLIALSVVALDCRHYGLVRQMADVIGGSNPFVSACMRVHASLEGAAVATNQPFIPDGDRPAFILRVAEGVLAAQGKKMETGGLGFMTCGTAQTEAVATAEMIDSNGPDSTIDQSARKKRTTRPIVDEE